MYWNIVTRIHHPNGQVLIFGVIGEEEEYHVIIFLLNWERYLYIKKIRGERQSPYDTVLSAYGRKGLKDGR